MVNNKLNIKKYQLIFILDGMKDIILETLNTKELVEVVESYIGDPRLCVDTSITVHNMLVGVDEKKYVAGSNIEKLLLNILKSHMNDPGICQFGSVALKIICYLDRNNLILLFIIILNCMYRRRSNSCGQSWRY